MAHLGGVRGRWELVVGGPAVVQVCAAEQVARPGDVVLSPEALDLLRDLATGEQVRLGAGGPSAFRLAGVRSPTGAAPLVRAGAVEAAGPALRGYVPAAVTARLAAGQSAWISELRTVSVLFVRLPGLDDISSDTLGAGPAARRRRAGGVVRVRGLGQQARGRRQGRDPGGRLRSPPGRPRGRRRPRRAGGPRDPGEVAAARAAPCSRPGHRPGVLRLGGQQPAPRVHDDRRRGQPGRPPHAGGRRRARLRRGDPAGDRGEARLRGAATTPAEGVGAARQPSSARVARASRGHPAGPWSVGRASRTCSPSG